MTEMERNNKIAMMTHGINVGIMAAFLILQAVAGELSIIYVGILCLIGFAPVIAEVVFWKIDHNTDMIKHFLAIGFAIFYSIIIFTSYR